MLLPAAAGSPRLACAGLAPIRDADPRERAPGDHRREPPGRAARHRAESDVAEGPVPGAPDFGEG